MELNKKNKFAENVKNKILNLQEVIEKGKRWKIVYGRLCIYEIWIH